MQHLKSFTTGGDKFVDIHALDLQRLGEQQFDIFFCPMVFGLDHAENEKKKIAFCFFEIDNTAGCRDHKAKKISRVDEVSARSILKKLNELQMLSFSLTLLAVSLSSQYAYHLEMEKKFRLASRQAF